jgi:hypothetical protein
LLRAERRGEQDQGEQLREDSPSGHGGTGQMRGAIT